jgi:hypothetical protein
MPYSEQMRSLKEPWAERLQSAAGTSNLNYGRRPHGARERPGLGMLAESGDEPVIGDNDRNLGAAMLAELTRIGFGYGLVPGRMDPCSRTLTRSLPRSVVVGAVRSGGRSGRPRARDRKRGSSPAAGPTTTSTWDPVGTLG